MFPGAPPEKIELNPLQYWTNIERAYHNIAKLTVTYNCCHRSTFRTAGFKEGEKIIKREIELKESSSISCYSHIV